MNPGDIYTLPDGSRRVVLSHVTYNVSALGRVITAVVRDAPESGGFDPFAVTTERGTVYADRIAMHPRHWLGDRVGQLDPNQLATLRLHLRYLLC